MTSNMWALIIGGVTAGGVVTGALVWRQNHPDVPIAQLASLAPSPPPKATAPPPMPKPPAQAQTGDIIKGPPPKPEPAAGHGEPPHFDVVRVEPSGDAVLAGKGDPNAKVALLASGKVVAETKSDAQGQFVIMPPPLKPGNYDLSLRQKPDGKPATASKQNVAVSVPPQSKGQVVIALAEPGKPTKLLSGPPEAPTASKPAPPIATAPPRAEPPASAAPPPKTPNAVALAKPETAVAPPAAIKPPGPDLAIRTVELENGNGFYVTGVAAAGTRIQIYLNGAHLTEVVAGSSTEWSLTVKKGLAGGHYIVRADAGADGRTVKARVEVPFDVPVAMAAAAKPTAPMEEKPAIEEPKPNVPPPSVAARMPHVAPPAKPLPPPAPEPAKVAEAKVFEQPKVEEPKPNVPPPSVAARMPHVAPPAKAPQPTAPEPTKVAEAKAAEQPVMVEEPKPNQPPPSVAARMPHVAPPAKAPQPTAPEPAKVAAAKATEQPLVIEEPKPNVPPPSVAARMPHDAPPMKAESKVAGAPSSVIARAAPPAPPASVPLPSPDTAAAAKAASAKAPGLAPPAFAVAPPTPPSAQPSPLPSQATVSPPHVPDPANAVIEQVETAVVVRGDNLWNISRDRLGVGYRYTRIYAANARQIRDPKLIYPGQVFVVPK